MNITLHLIGPIRKLGAGMGHFKASVVGEVIKVFLNGSQINTATDSAIKYGQPGIGMWLSQDGAPGNLAGSTFGFIDYSATN